MTEMIEAEPTLAARLLSHLAAPAGGAARLAAALAAAAAAGTPVFVIGCGTSEHGAQAVAEILRGAIAGIAPVAMQAFEASLEPQLGGRGPLVVGISHEGGTCTGMCHHVSSASRCATGVPRRGIGRHPISPAPRRTASWGVPNRLNSQPRRTYSG